jgi:uncharacterized protein (TIGR03083 family)
MADDIGLLYREARQSLTDFLVDLTPDEVATAVPTTPGWTVDDVVGHLLGIVDDALAGRLQGPPDDMHTMAQVLDRRHLSLAAKLEAWSKAAPALEQRLSTSERPSTAIVFDVVVHHQDIRGALGRPGARETPATQWAVKRLSGRVGALAASGELPALRLVLDGVSTVCGTGEPSVALTISSWELFRVVRGRRSRRQIAALAWEGDASGYVDRLSVFGPSVADIVE